MLKMFNLFYSARSIAHENVLDFVLSVYCDGMYYHKRSQRGGGGKAPPPPPPIMLFRSFVGRFGNLSVGPTCKPTRMSFVPTKYMKYQRKYKILKKKQFYRM